MAQTQYLQLGLVGTSAEELEMLFLDWRLLAMGENQSNMIKIDDGFYSLDTRTTSLEAKTSFVTDEGMGNKFLADDGTYKLVSGGGGGGSVFMTDSYQVFTAQSDTQTFTIAKTTDESQVVLYKDNLLMIKDVDYTIDKTTGVVDLPFTLLTGESIYYQVNKGYESLVTSGYTGDVSIATSKFLFDDVGNVVSPKVKREDVVGLESVLVEDDIADNLTTTIKGKLLDASQGKLLSDTVGKLSTLTTENKTSLVNAINELVTSSDTPLQFRGVCQNDLSDTTLTSGIWITEVTEELTNIPSWWLKNTRKTIINFATDGFNTLNFMLIIDRSVGEVCYQIGTSFHWASLTNDTRFPFYCTANDTIQVVSQECYVVKQEFTVNLRITRMDRTSFEEMVVATLPANFVPSHYVVGNAIGKNLTDTSYARHINCFVGSDGKIRIIPQDTNVKEIVLSIKGGCSL